MEDIDKDKDGFISLEEYIGKQCFYTVSNLNAILTDVLSSQDEYPNTHDGKQCFYAV
jgi:hypothetical protein